LLVFSAKMLGDRMKRDNMVGCNDKIVLENQLNVGKCRNFECRQFKSDGYGDVHIFVSNKLL
jgi:hypothetical protein